ncbi:MAG: YaiO family outer membrane beta-barrel protein [Rugosibacter sp.]
MRKACLALLVLYGVLGKVHAAEETTQAELRVSQDSLGRDYADWRSIEAQLLHRMQDGRAIYGSLRETRRFSLDDQELFAGAYLPLPADWAAVVEGSTSPSHEVLARWSAFGQLQRKFAYGWNLQAGWRHTEYNNAGTSLASLTAERYWRNYRAAFTTYSGRLDGVGGTFPSGRMQLDYYYGDRNRIGFSLSAGREAENVGAAGVLVSKVRDAALAGSHWVSPQWAITYVANVHRQGDIYTRHGIELGVRRRF